MSFSMYIYVCMCTVLSSFAFSDVDIGVADVSVDNAVLPWARAKLTRRHQIEKILVRWSDCLLPLLLHQQQQQQQH